MVVRYFSERQEHEERCYSVVKKEYFRLPPNRAKKTQVCSTVGFDFKYGSHSCSLILAKSFPVVCLMKLTFHVSFDCTAVLLCR